MLVLAECMRKFAKGQEESSLRVQLEVAGRLGHVPSRETASSLRESKQLLVRLICGSKHFLFFHILGIILPIDFHMFQVSRSTTNQFIAIVVVPARHQLCLWRDLSESHPADRRYSTLPTPTMVLSQVCKFLC